jgi:hypothetical protein
MMKMIAGLMLAGAMIAPAHAQTATAYSDRLLKLGELQRHSVLRRAILDSGELCKRVERAAVSGAYKNLVVWTARCTPGGDYGVFLGPDASVQVRRCAETKTLGLPPCRLPLVAK